MKIKVDSIIRMLLDLLIDLIDHSNVQGHSNRNNLGDDVQDVSDEHHILLYLPGLRVSGIWRKGNLLMSRYPGEIH